MELWKWLKALRPRESSSASSSECVRLLQGSRRPVLDTDMGTPVEAGKWPACIEQLSFGADFNQPIDVVVVLPASLNQLTFGWDCTQPIAGVVWQATLKQPSYGCFFNQPIVGGMLPTSLQQLSFTVVFNQPIAEIVWPAVVQ